MSLSVEIATAAAAGILGTLEYVPPQALKIAAIRQLRSLCRRRHVMVLTYDDGPGATLSRRVLNQLDHQEVRVTFFALGARAEQHPEVLDEIVAAGHEVGCHGQWHTNAWKSMPWTAIRDTRIGYRSLERWVRSDGLFRPPCGKLVLATAWDLWRRGAPIGWWTIDSGDTHAVLPDPKTIVEAVRQDGGGVVLMHDFDRSPATIGERSDYVLTVTRMLLDLAKQEGLDIRTLGEVLRCP